MSEFLLLGIRPVVPGELSPARAARDLVALATWHRCLRRWGLLRSFAVGHQGRPRSGACLVVQVSSPAAAWRLAAGWERLAGYDVTVLQLVDTPAGRAAGERRG